MFITTPCYAITGIQDIQEYGFIVQDVNMDLVYKHFKFTDVYNNGNPHSVYNEYGGVTFIGGIGRRGAAVFKHKWGAANFSRDYEVYRCESYKLPRRYSNWNAMLTTMTLATILFTGLYFVQYKTK